MKNDGGHCDNYYKIFTERSSFVLDVDNNGGFTNSTCVLSAGAPFDEGDCCGATGSCPVYSDP